MSCSFDDARSFFGGVFLCFFDDFSRAALGIDDTFLRLFMRLRQLNLHALLGYGQLMLTTIGSSETFRDFLCALVQHFHQRRPHELHREKRQDEKDDELRKQGCVQVHGIFLLKLTIAGAIPGRMRMMESASERVCEREHHRDTNTDQERRIDQTSKQEHFGLQAVHQFWLASRGFDEFAAHDANADTCANSAEADDQTTSECYESDVSHENSLDNQKSKTKPEYSKND
jgi:hypothetical protein